MIQVRNLSKFFGSTQVLYDVSFEIKKGEIVGFLGPNGAGKTTLMRILTSYFPPTKGKVNISGFDISKNSLFIRKKIGYLPETPPLYPDMTVRDYLKFAAKIKGVGRSFLRTKIDMALEDCHITDVAHKTISTLSKGYKQRVGIAQAIIHDPEILIFDEPTTGLDPLQIRQVRNLIKRLEYKRTVIVSTHILSEIEQIAKRVIIIDNGKIATDQRIENILVDPNSNEKISLEEAFLKFTTSNQL